MPLRGTCLPWFLLLLCLCLAALGQQPFQSVLTEANWDMANTQEFPPHPDAKGGFGTAASREDGLARALHLRLPLSAHGSWLTGETDQPQRYFRIAFKQPLPIGTLIGGAGTVSYLKADAPFPGDVTNDTLWTPVPIPEGQAGQRVVPFPPGVVTRAIRLVITETPPPGQQTRSGFGGLLLLQARLHNLTPEATAFASSQMTGAANVVEANRVRNLITGGTWTAAPKQDVDPDHPEWVIFTWPQAKRLTGVGFINAFAKHLEIEALKFEELGHPAVAPETAWTKAGALDWPIWWRPAYTDAYVPFAQPVSTRAVRVRVTQPLTTENPDVAHTSSNTRRKVSLAGVQAFTDLGAAPVPPRPKAAAELPPINIKYQMPYAGKLTLAINDAAGKRVRNLVAEVDRNGGLQTEAWDGRDDRGKLVTPGTYTWKAITHQPLHLAYQATVNCSGNPPWWKSSSWGDQLGPGSWLSDHATPNDVTAIGDRVFIGAVIAESGHTILACDLDGKKIWGTKWLETAGAGFLTNDGTKVYSVGEGGWIGDRLMIHEIDPQTFKWRRVTQLVFDSGATPGGGVSGVAARDGKLYVAFNRPAPSWFSSAIATANLDEAATSPVTLAQPSDLFGLLRTRGNVPAHGVWRTAESAAPAQHLRLAFKAMQPVGAVVARQALEVSALKPDAPYPGDLADDAQWTPFAAAQSGPLCVMTAPPGLQTRALRITFRKNAADGKPWTAALEGALILPRRFANVAAGATYTVSSGEVKGDGAWTTVRETAIIPTNPAVLTLAWPEARTFRGLGFVGLFAKRVEILAYTGPAGADLNALPETAWRKLGEVTPAVRWRPNYSDDYFDAGENITASALRVRVVEPWIGENLDIASTTGGKPTRAQLGGVIALQAIGDDPATAEVPSQRISVVNIADGKWERNIAVPAPRFPHFDPQGNLVAISGTQVVRIALADGAVTPVPTGKLADPRGLTFDAQGNLYVADGGPSQVKVFAPDGTLVRTIAQPGGRRIGTYDQHCLANPQGIAVDQRGHLWVTEGDYQPKRTSLWAADGTFLNEFIGPAQYGAGGFLDPRDKSRFYYTGMEFAIDWKTGAWKVKQLLSRGQDVFNGGYVDHPVYLNGKQYMVNDPGVVGGTAGGLLYVGEFRKDRVVPLSVVGNADAWTPFTSDPALRTLVEGKALGFYSFAWADRNGDAQPQPEEVILSEQGVRLNGTYWPTYVSKKLEVQMGGRLLKPTGYTACGAPIYQPFTAQPLPALPAENIYATAVDGSGRVLVNGRPVLALQADGTVPWSYPQQWVGIHDSHGAPSPQPGQLIGGLGFIGQEEVPGLGEIFMLSGNKGEWYLFTADGLLAATLWRDYRLPGALSWNFPEAKRGMSLDNVTVGEEHFGGGFVKTSDGKFYLIAGHNHNSIAELSGLETMKRQQGTLTVTAKDLAAAEAWITRQAMAAAQKEAPKFLTVTAPSAPVTPDGKLDEWPAEQFQPIANRGAFALAYDATNLYLAVRVDNNNAVRNAGDDPTLLFKTGDSVDLQLGVDPRANPARTAPIPGDQRLLLTLYQGKPVGVLYQHRVPGTPQAEKTGFASPWRTEFVDKILRLDPANIGIARTPQGYAVEAVVPLAVLGLAPLPGVTYKLDAGILTADSSGGATQVRTYWANQATGVVSDVPSEIMLTPGLWGDLQFQ